MILGQLVGEDVRGNPVRAFGEDQTAIDADTEGLAPIVLLPN